jgi:uncharacterized membrane protein YhaH (DUF805 family)
MSDPDGPASVAKPRDGFRWLGGRAGRREYGVYVALLLVVSFALSYTPPIVSIGLTLVLIFTQIRRLHDFGRSGWWAVGASLVPLVPGIPLMMSGQTDLGLAVGVLVELALIVVIGAIPGTPGDNRFGPAPPFTARRVLTGR